MNVFSDLLGIGQKKETVQTPTSRRQKHIDESLSAHQRVRSAAAVDNRALELENIDMFYREDFDPVRYALQEIPETADAGYYLEQQKKYEMALDAVGHKLSNKVMKNYNAFVQGMSQVQEVGMDLSMTSVLCKTARQRLRSAQDELVKGGLTILAKYRKRRALLALINYINKIKEITQLDTRVRELLEEGDYPQAIQLMLEQKALISKYIQFEAVKSMLVSFQANYDLIEKKIDVSLLQCCRSFSPILYERALTAYKLLGSTFDVTEKLQKNYVDTIDSLSNEVVFSYALKSTQAQQKAERLSRMKFSDLCRSVSDEDLLPCMLQLFAVLSDVMYNYYNMCSWHMHAPNTSSDTNSDDGTKRYDFKEVRVGINSFRKTVWDIIQRKVSVFLSSCAYTEFKVDRFLQVFHAVSLFMELGEAFGETENSFSLRGSLTMESKKFFLNHHIECLGVIRVMFMSENWQPLPSAGFSEIRELKASHAMSQVSHQSNKQRMLSFLQSSDPTTNPFRKAAQQGTLMPSDDDNQGPSVSENNYNEYDDDEELEDDDEDEYEDENDTKVASLSKKHNGSNGNNNNNNDGDESKGSRNKKKKEQSGPTLTNISLQLARFMGRYLQAMEILQSISMEVFTAFTQLFQFYLYNIFAHFANTGKESFLQPELDAGPETPYELKVTFSNIRESLNKLAKAQNISNENLNSFAIAELGPHIDLKTERMLFGLMERSTAAESLVFLKDIITSMSPKIKSLVPKSNAADVQQFVDNTSKSVDEVLKVIYTRCATSLINLEGYLPSIANCKWDKKQMSYEHNPYIDQMLKDYAAFGAKLKRKGSSGGSNTGGYVPELNLTDRVVDLLWDHAIRYGMETLVEGFSRAKKCTNEGRAQMTMDLTQFQKGLEKLTSLRPIPHTNIVNIYIKGYYMMTEEEFIEFAKEHMEYTAKQVASLLMVSALGPQLKKKNKQDLLQKIEEIHALDPRGSSTSGSSGPTISVGGIINVAQAQNTFRKAMSQLDKQLL